MTPLAFLSPIRALVFAALGAVCLVPSTRAVSVAPMIEWQQVDVAPPFHIGIWWTSERQLHLRIMDGADVVIGHVTEFDVMECGAIE